VLTLVDADAQVSTQRQRPLGRIAPDCIPVPLTPEKNHETGMHPERRADPEKAEGVDVPPSGTAGEIAAGGSAAALLMPDSVTASR